MVNIQSPIPTSLISCEKTQMAWLPLGDTGTGTSCLSRPLSHLPIRHIYTHRQQSDICVIHGSCYDRQSLCSIHHMHTWSRAQTQLVSFPDQAPKKSGSVSFSFHASNLLIYKYYQKSRSVCIPEATKRNQSTGKKDYFLSSNLESS